MLSGEALAWASPLWKCGEPFIFSSESFLFTFRKVCAEPGHISSATSALLHLRQGASIVGEICCQISHRLQIYLGTTKPCGFHSGWFWQLILKINWLGGKFLFPQVNLYIRERAKDMGSMHFSSGSCSC